MAGHFCTINGIDELGDWINIWELPGDETFMEFGFITRENEVRCRYTDKDIVETP